MNAVRIFHAGTLEVVICASRAELGAAAAAACEADLAAQLARTGEARVIFAAAPSQNELLAGLCASRSLDWRRVEAFHLDEYAGIAPGHPASFRRFLRERLMDRVPIGAFHELRGEAPDCEAECSRYAALLEAAKPGLAVAGVGENGHLAFIDPPVCDFDDARDVRVVDLDETCRMQQVHDGAFARIEDVPRRALSLTIPVLMRTPRLVVAVPGKAKRRAVRDALEGPISPACPASILRRHAGATLFLDEDSAAELKPAPSSVPSRDR
jgi:glucosamine-6-phosphate deaminase